MPSFRQQRETLERWRELPALERAEPGSRTVALTFDDGPDPEGTPAVLDRLEAERLSATFFLVGSHLERHADLAAAVAGRGHEVALHGFAHVAHDSLGAGAREDLERGMAAVEAATGVRPRWYRPPYGRFSRESYEACRHLGLAPAYWSASGYDWETISPERIAELSCRDLEDGDVLLLHDSARYAPRPSPGPTAEAVPLIARGARSLGLEPVTLGQAVDGRHHGAPGR